jgi:hypothetical protein
MNYGMFSGLNGATFLMRLSSNVVLNAGVGAGFAQGQTSASGTKPTGPVCRGPLLGVDRTWLAEGQTDAKDPKRTSAA